MSAVAAGIIATLTRERDEAREMAARLFWQWAELDDDPEEWGRWAYRSDNPEWLRPPAEFIERHPWLRQETEDDPD